MRRTDLTVLALVAANYALEAALLTHVEGFALPPVAIFAIAVVLAPIGPVLAILPQLGVRVPTLPTLAPVAEETAAAETPLHPAP